MYPIYVRLLAQLTAENVSFKIYEHPASFTVADAEAYLSFPLERLVKTIAFKTRSGQYVLAAVLSTGRIDYRRLAQACQTQRDNISSLSPREVKETLGVEPGSVGPLNPLPEGSRVLFDSHTQMDKTVFCGCGRPDRTLEIQFNDLLRLSHATLIDLVKDERG